MKSLVRVGMRGIAAGLLVGFAAVSPSAVLANTQAQQTASAIPSSEHLWVKFSQPKTLVAIDGRGNTQDLLAETTLQGAYNQQQRSSRLFLVQGDDDLSWLKDGVPSSTTVTNLKVQSSDPDGALKAMLATYGSDIKGAIVTDPANPETVNLATTLAGIDDAMVITPAQESLIGQYHIRILDDFRRYHLQGVVPTYQWAIKNLLPKTNTKMLVMLVPGIQGNIRDYAVATKSFVFNLTTTNFDKQINLMETILNHTPKNTPIMGYIQSEGPDVYALSAMGHFLNASDFLTNESVWASMPSPAKLTQPTPHAVKVTPGTVYVAFLVSDGDNAQYVEHRMYSDWHLNQYGAVPMAWTIAPGMVEFAPTLLEWYYKHLPSNQELIPGPSGIGYATGEDGANLKQFAQLSGKFMQRDDMHVVDYWGDQSALPTYAQQSGILGISYENQMPYQKVGNTVLYGQTSGYIGLSALLGTIQTASEPAAQGKPVFLEPLVDAWNVSPTDIASIAQQLAAQGQYHYVFLTPSELALTMKDYYEHKEQGLPQYNAAAVPAENFLPGHGANLVQNPSGGTFWLTTGWNLAHPGQNSYLNTVKYNGNWAFLWGTNVNDMDSASYYPAVEPGGTYRFSVKLAGKGKAELNVWNGTKNVSSNVVQLSSTYRTETLTVTIPDNASTGQSGSAPQLQIVKPSGSTAKVYFTDASVVQLSQSAKVPTGNLVYNPSGVGGNTSGWSMAYNGDGANLRGVTVSGQPALEWDVQGNLGHDDWIKYYPAVVNGETYTFSAELSGSGQAFLDVYNGTKDITTQSVQLGSNFQKVSIDVTIPNDAPTGQSDSAPQLQIRVAGKDPAKVLIRNASVTKVS